MRQGGNERRRGNLDRENYHKRMPEDQHPAGEDQTSNNPPIPKHAEIVSQQHTDTPNYSQTVTNSRPHWADVIIAIFTGLILLTYITSDYFLWRQLKITSGQLDQMKNSSVQTGDLITATQNLAIASTNQASSMADLAQAAKDQVTKLGAEVKESHALAAASQETAKAAVAQSVISAKSLEANQRPWVSFDTTITSPLTFDDNWSSLTLVFDLRNTGGSTAVFVGFATGLYIDSQLQPNAFAERERVCQRAISYGALGGALFVGHSQSHQWSLGTPMKDLRIGELYSPTVIACVGYRSPVNDTAIFYTAAIMRVMRLRYIDSKGRPSFAIVPPDSVPVADLYLWEDPMSGGLIVK